MSHVNNIIYTPASLAGDIAAQLGSSSRSAAALCTSPAIKRFAKCKPFIHSSKAFASDAARESARVSAHYGISAPVVDIVANLFNADWTYASPVVRTNPLRLLDFKGYYHDAPEVLFQQAVGHTITIDKVNPIAGSEAVPMYVYQKADGAYKDKDFVHGGYGTSHGRTADQLALCLGSEDIIFGSSGSTTLYSQTTYLAVVAFSTSGQYLGEALATVALSHPSVTDNNMTVIPISDLVATLGSGTFKLVACAKFTDERGSHYLPAHSFSAGYPNKMTLTIGGGNMYPASAVGGSLSAEYSTSTQLYTNLWAMYFSVKVHNTTDRTWQFTHTLSQVVATIHLSGSRNYMGTTQTISRDETASLVSASSYFIAPGEYAQLVFRVADLWAVTPPEQAVILQSGRVVLSLSALTYKNIALNIDPGQAVVVNYQ